MNATAVTRLRFRPSTPVAWFLAVVLAWCIYRAVVDLQERPLRTLKLQLEVENLKLKNAQLQRSHP